VRRGEVYGFVGPNGAGKTTTVPMLVGLIRPTSGTAIAGRLQVSETTVKTHVAHVLDKLGLRDRVQAVIVAYEAGLAGSG
jgi:ABC-type multidrug transport system ATPase subunit